MKQNINLLYGLILLVIINFIGKSVNAQGGSGGSAQPDRIMTIAEIVVVWDSIQPSAEVSKR